MFVYLFICFFLVENFYVYFLEFNNCVCKFDKNRNKYLLKKKKRTGTSQKSFIKTLCYNIKVTNKLTKRLPKLSNKEINFTFLI